MQINSDKKILLKIKNGDIASFERLFREYYQNLCNYVFSIIKDMDTSEEIIQDLFFNIWEKHEQLSINSSIKAYLFRSAYNNTISYLRHEAVVNRHFNEIKANSVIAQPDAFETFKVFELNEALNKAINELPKRYKQIFIMNRFEGMKYIEIAEKLSISVKTVEAAISKSLKILRNKLKNLINKN